MGGRKFDGNIELSERVKKLCISPDTSIEDAARCISEGGEKIALVVDENGVLCGVFVDGDLRRALINHIPITSPVSEVMSVDPKVCFSDDINAAIKAKDMMLRFKIEHIPVVDRRGRLVDIYFWRDFFVRPHIDYGYRVVIMAGGKGNRLDPFTKILPKPLIPIGNKPIVEHIMRRFSKSGFNSFLLSLNYKAEMVKMYFSDGFNDWDIEYIVEKKPLGTVGSLSLMKENLRDTFFLTNCDILVDEDYGKILEYHKKKGCILTVVVSQKNIVIPYGVLKLSNDGMLLDIEEKPSYNLLVNTGFYLVEPEVLSFIPDDTCFSMVDLIRELHKRKLPIGGFPIREDAWFDVGQWSEYRRTLKHFESEEEI